MGRKTDLPPFAVLPELMGRGGGNMPNGQAGGFLGKAQDPFVLNADPSKPNFRVPDLLPPQEIGTVRLDRRRKIRDWWTTPSRSSRRPRTPRSSTITSRPRSGS